MDGDEDETQQQIVAVEPVTPKVAAIESKAKKKDHILVNRTVINEKLIRDAVVEDFDGSEAGRQLKPEEVDLSEVKEVTLSFKNIFTVGNLLGLEKLVKLQLDNNIIEKIENLEHLVSLEWLDLSFNNISKIENLDKLVNLTDLSLFNNRIKTIENLECLTKINVLSLGTL